MCRWLEPICLVTLQLMMALPRASRVIEAVGMYLVDFVDHDAWCLTCKATREKCHSLACLRGNFCHAIAHRGYVPPKYYFRVASPWHVLMILLQLLCPPPSNSHKTRSLTRWSSSLTGFVTVAINDDTRQQQQMWPNISSMLLRALWSRYDCYLFLDALHAILAVHICAPMPQQGQERHGCPCFGGRVCVLTQWYESMRHHAAKHLLGQICCSSPSQSVEKYFIEYFRTWHIYGVSPKNSHASLSQTAAETPFAIGCGNDSNEETKQKERRDIHDADDSEPDDANRTRRLLVRRTQFRYRHLILDHVREMNIQLEYKDLMYLSDFFCNEHMDMLVGRLAAMGALLESSPEEYQTWRLHTPSPHRYMLGVLRANHVWPQFTRAMQDKLGGSGDTPSYYKRNNERFSAVAQIFDLSS